MFFCLATAIQALVQYPLHYAYFLGTVAFVLGAFDTDARRVAVGRRLAAYALVLAALAGSALFSAQRDYARLLALSQRSFDYYAQEPAAWLMARNDLARMAGDSFIAPWATRTLAAMMTPERERAAEQSFLCQRAMRTAAPAPEFGTKCAVLLAILGQSAEAADLVSRFAATFPASRPAMRALLVKEARRFPEVAPLLARMPDDEVKPTK